jgi:hypothetical protein
MLQMRLSVSRNGQASSNPTEVSIYSPIEVKPAVAARITIMPYGDIDIARVC